MSLASDHALLNDVELVDGRVLLEHRLHRSHHLDGHGQRQLQLEVVVHLPLVPFRVDAAEVVHAPEPVAVELLNNLALHLARGSKHDVLPPVAVPLVVPEDVIRPEPLAQAWVPRVEPFLSQETVQNVHAVVEALVSRVQRGDRRDHPAHQVRVDETRGEVADGEV